MRKIFENNPEFDGHKLVSTFYEKNIGLKGYIAIHNTTLGPAVGGTRFWIYKNEKDALSDVLRLSKSMTYKCALAGVPFGGGKAVIIANKHTKKNKKFLELYASKINLLNGMFFTGEDVGLTMDDIKILVKHSKYVIGGPKNSGDPSPWAALGVYYSILASVECIYSSRSLYNKKIAVKGLGKVGGGLIKYLYKSGADIYVADIDESRIKYIKKKYPKIHVVSADRIHKQKVDVYAPCALGKEFTKKTINELQCKIICGAANNQLGTKEDGIRLFKKGILYIPDYLANSGGLINVVSELEKDGYNRKKVSKKVKGIYDTTKKIINTSIKTNRPTSEVADSLAKTYFEKY